MKVGMLARGEDRGLGNLTWEWYRHMRPDRTLLVIPQTVQKAGLSSHEERYPDATVIRQDARALLDPKVIRPWLQGLDVVYTAETFYDWRLCKWARELGVATVVHAMPEFTRREWFPHPTQWWLPTSYRSEYFPAGTRQVPVPIPTNRWPAPRPVRPKDLPLTWLHVAGAQTVVDRNGTRAVMRALRHTHSRVRLDVSTQEPLELGSPPPNVTVEQSDGNLSDYWRLYDYADVLLLPRRYAGLCLPALEAMGAGLPVVMTDMKPQSIDWPVTTVATHKSPLTWRWVEGSIECGDASVEELGALIDRWNEDRSHYEYAHKRAAAFVEGHSWDALRPTIIEELELAVTRLHAVG